ncbi:hypothetical protein OUZ56_008639 [Daphnia magna]|uniref:Uncharacterized protein n=1 Tax=Daphnia magna TaxID=35525 RepID=A0ABR0ADL8_9CRUS|nr:hypothetical protein OUZ56_008639 [Daphnia magna]
MCYVANNLNTSFVEILYTRVQQSTARFTKEGLHIVDLISNKHSVLFPECTLRPSVCTAERRTTCTVKKNKILLGHRPSIDFVFLPTNSVREKKSFVGQ